MKAILIGTFVAGAVATLAFSQSTPVLHIENWGDVACPYDGVVTIRIDNAKKTLDIRCE